MTNGDFIRNMSDDEIAEAMSRPGTTVFCAYCAYRESCFGNECKDGIMKWLKQEATDETD